jgi:hypothetical protein
MPVDVFAVLGAILRLTAGKPERIPDQKKNSIFTDTYACTLANYTRALTSGYIMNNMYEDDSS